MIVASKLHMYPIDLSKFAKFEKLTLEELRIIATEVGINFLAGNGNIKDKWEFITTFDEADPKELEESYNRVINRRAK